MAKKCGLCGVVAEDAAALAAHMESVHDWGRVTAAQPPERWVYLYAAAKRLVPAALLLWLAASLVPQMAASDVVGKVLPFALGAVGVLLVFDGLRWLRGWIGAK
jgi:hypothetical protein